MNEFLMILFYISMSLWVGWGVFLFYTRIRDDIRREKERKEKKK